MLSQLRTRIESLSIPVRSGLDHRVHKSQLMRILTCPSHVETLYIRERLSAEGFHPMPISSSGLAWHAGTDLSLVIEVPPEEAEEARSLLVELGYSDLLT